MYAHPPLKIVEERMLGDERRSPTRRDAYLAEIGKKVPARVDVATEWAPPKARPAPASAEMPTVRPTHFLVDAVELDPLPLQPAAKVNCGAEVVRERVTGVASGPEIRDEVVQVRAGRA
jgi:hypothetical protein